MTHMPSGRRKRRGLANRTARRLLSHTEQESNTLGTIRAAQTLAKLHNISTAVFKLYENAQQSHKSLQKSTATLNKELLNKQLKAFTDLL